MAHFALLNSDNIVVRVARVANTECVDANGVEREEIGQAFLKHMHGGGNWVQTSYNATIRKHYAGVGFSYNPVLDAFIEPKPYDTWTLNETTCKWEPPVSYPSDSGSYIWDSDATNWVAITP